ncbi:hypothetical protein EXE46_01370 [Halorubrum sp. GN11_10-6_MGM]|uniref:Sjogren's syndrome/scleroderma autoantigen 1 family protein n=1 Tax=Halorubrum sp. GN11_10-6_MGM TaxID=2518112 RepID=UPI0010F80397|nr:Sjogren's syndrome/scleroderma autoantigen 1 family protein [Halorubrum sp. GN11_10-6_MGM]TKX75773.1 hypothetical protein EXE46_01370 [Halorubrum sp. GN11_10-6_MGM]
MSDGFDKEAEREKLREKLADDEQKREHTQRMSELLLKGATMTNRHCDACGDPIFRHDGREFCPTCGNEVGGGTGETTETAADADGTAADADAAAADGAAAENGSIDAGSADTVAPDPTDAGVVDAAPTETAQSPSSPPTPAPSQESVSSQSSSPSQGAAPPQRSEPQPPASRQSTPSQSADDAGGVDAARASLTRTLTRFARAAEETDDPRRARDHLEAAREAAEALAALER